MGQKNIVATIYIKHGMAVSSPTNFNNPRDVVELANYYNDTGVDKIICYDLSKDEDEREVNVNAIREINNISEIKCCAGGNVNNLEDVKSLFFVGCVEVILNGSKKQTAELLEEAALRYGTDKILVSIKTMDFVFKNKELVEKYAHEIIVLDKSLLNFNGFENNCSVPYIVNVPEYDEKYLVEILSSTQIRGISGEFIDNENDIMSLKSTLANKGIKLDNFNPKLSWKDLKPMDNGLIPVIAQDYITKEVLMLAYMNEESFNQTIRTGKMTYYSRSRKKLWVKGETSGHLQFVKQFTADCDKDTLLALVSQVGGIACHTGAKSCFFNEIVKKEYIEKNPLKVFETIYNLILDRRENPKEGSYTNYVMSDGLDGVLKHAGEKAVELMIASKNDNKEVLKYKMSNYLYHLMILMVECDITWDDVTKELMHK